MIEEKIAHYKILQKLGEGGMGVVYKARDLKLLRFVALKFLPQFYHKNKSSRKRFVLEAQAASGLDHPNICTIHEIDETKDGQLYISMAYYDGESLRQKLKRGPIPYTEALNIIYQIAQGLNAAHGKNIVHRDIKPANIIVSKNGDVKIVDFGLAKLAGGKFTESVSTKGTIAYMSPEVIRDLPVDKRADIWSLGIMFFEMLTSNIPFEGNYAEPMIYNIVNEEPKSLSHYLEDVPNFLQTIIDKLLEKNPQERYQNISDLLVDLESLMEKYNTEILKTKPALMKQHIFSEHNTEYSIAVLPLQSIEQESEQEWFTYGMTDALITELAQIGRLKVISRSTIMQYNGINIAPTQIANELGVQYLVDGSVTKMGDLIKVTARLINALEDKYIWAKDYQRGFINILGLQSEIAKEIANQIEVQLTPEEEKRFAERRPVNPETYSMYLKGLYHLNKLTPEGIGKGLAYLQRSVEENPMEPLAHAALSIAYSTIAHGASLIPDALSRAKSAALNALELDESLAEAHLALTMVKIFFDMDWTSAIQSNKRALELNPNLALAHWVYGYLLRIPGQFEEGHTEMNRAQQLDPLNPVYAADRGWMFYYDRKFDESIEECLKSLDINPEFPQAYCILGSAYAAKGMYEEAISAQQKAGELSLDWKWGLAQTYILTGFTDEALKIAAELEKRALTWDTWCLAVVYAALGDGEKVFYWLEKAYRQHHPFIQWIGRTFFGAFKEDPRYIDLAKRLNLPE